jgi:hypothetical protein
MQMQTMPYHNHQINALENNPRSQPRIIYPPATRKSSWNAIPSCAAVNNKEYQSQENKAAGDGEDWATDNLIPIIEDDDEDNTHVVLMASEPPPEPHNLYVPKTFSDAFKESRCHLWYPPMVKEIQRWDKREVVTAVPRLPDIKMIKTKWVYDLKLDGIRDLMRRRAWGVVKGFDQIHGEHYFKSFAAVVRYDSVRMLFAIIASHGLDFWLIDFVGAYLNAKP